MRRRKRMDDDSEYVPVDAASGGIMQLTEDLMTETEKRKARVRLRVKPVRPIGFVHPGGENSNGR